MIHIKTLHKNEPNEINTFQKGNEIIVETKQPFNKYRNIMPFYLDEALEQLSKEL